MDASGALSGAPGGRRPQLDSLRALAVGGVLFGHLVPAGHPLALLNVLPWATLGVQLFFVLSGALITGILLDCAGEVAAGRQSLRETLARFYARRFLRILPAYYATLLLTAATLWPLVREGLAWHLLYLSNFYLVHRGGWADYVSHFWTLAVEEQFYLLWPLALLLLRPARRLRAVLALCAAAPLFRLATWLAGAPELWRIVLLPSCMDALGAGALLALLRAEPARERARRRLARAGLVAALPAYALLVQLGATLRGTLDADVLEGTLSALFCLWAVDGAATGFGGLAGRVLSSAPLRYVGRISYAVYLLHPFAPKLLATLCAAAGVALGPEASLLGEVALTLALASLSWHALERPVNAWKERLPYHRVAAAEGPLPEATRGGGA